VSALERAAEDWIADHPAARHLIRTRDWVLTLEPSAGEHLRIAALVHDVERRVPGGPVPDVAHREWEDSAYVAAHSERSAAIADQWLARNAASIALREQVARLIRAHETGGWPEADVLQAADSLSFLEVQSHRVIAWVAEGRCATADARAKLDSMRDRISLPAARRRAEPLYASAVAALEESFPERG
jgi:predicted RNA-binding Zn ribbon-like protein